MHAAFFRTTASLLKFEFCPPSRSLTLNSVRFQSSGRAAKNFVFKLVVTKNFIDKTWPAPLGTAGPNPSMAARDKYTTKLELHRQFPSAIQKDKISEKKGG
jgi:hypothetical protein